MQLHEYQTRAKEWLRGKPSAILAVEMGLGKTATVLHYLAEAAPASSNTSAYRSINDF